MTYGQPPAGSPGDPNNQGRYTPPPSGYTPPSNYPPQPGGYMPPPATYTPPGGIAAVPSASYLPGAGTGRRTVRHIDVGSAMKVGGVLSALVWAILGLIFLVLSLCAGGLFASAFPNGNGPGLFAGNIVVSLIFYVVGIVLYAIFGAIFFAIYAWLYNVTASWTGGLQIDVQ